MTGTVLGYTQNYALSMLQFGAHNWHTHYNRNVQVLDSLLFAATGLSGVLGEWENNTVYVIGNRVTDADSGNIYQCEVNNTSASTGDFAADRLANPTYWNNITGTPINRGVWTNSVVYNANDFVIDNRRYAVCVTTHTSNGAGTFDDDSANWEVLIDQSTINDDPTLSDISTLTIPATVEGFEVSGHTTAGDGGGCFVKREGSAPSHSGYEQSADGAYWVIQKPKNGWIPTRCFGEMGDGANYDTEINNAVAFATAADCHVLFVGPHAKADSIQLGSNTAFVDPPNFFGLGMVHNANTNAANSLLEQDSGNVLPLLVFEGARLARYGYLALLSAVDVSTLTESTVDLTQYSAWVSVFGVDAQHSPDNVAVGIDPFLADGGAGHTLLDPYTGATYHLYQSSDVRGYHVLFYGWNIAIAAQMGDRQSNGDFITHDTCQFIRCRFMHSCGNGQARNTTFSNCTGNRIYMLLVTDFHGDLNGRIAGGLFNCSFAGFIGFLGSFHGTATPGPLWFTGTYIEGLWSHFEFTGGGSSTTAILLGSCFFNHNHERSATKPGNGKVPAAVTTGVPATAGTWINGESYVIGNDVRDRTTRLVYECLVNHTAAGSGDFTADRVANPTYWSGPNAANRTIVPVYYDACAFVGLAEHVAFFQNFPIMQRGTLIASDEYGYDDWAISTAYARGEMVEDGSDVYVCLIANTSGAGTFAADRAANPNDWLRVDDLWETGQAFNNSYTTGTPRTVHGQDDDMWNGAGTFTTRTAPATNVGGQALNTITVENRIVNYANHPAFATYGVGSYIHDEGTGMIIMVVEDGAGIALTNHNGTTVRNSIGTTMTATFFVPA